MSNEAKKCCGSLGRRHKKDCPGDVKESNIIFDVVSKTEEVETNDEVVNESKEEILNETTSSTGPKVVIERKESVEQLIERINDLEKKDEENQKKLKLLYEVADKGRIFNYENQNVEKKSMRVKLSVLKGKIIVGWRTVRDELITDPRTGATVGETQQYDILLMDENGQMSTEVINGYLNFSNARYNERIECEVISRSESFDGKITFNVRLPNGNDINLDSRFIN